LIQSQKTSVYHLAGRCTRYRPICRPNQKRVWTIT